ncbi:MAG TPA: CbiQ family ECF transporter T component [Thiobacillus sp.]|nr:CbiQ family ECF transporter T component [Thiobacillus sp.]
MADFLHPAARLLLWGGWAVAVEIAAPLPLMLPAVALATAFLFSAVRQHGFRLLRRTRWLLLVLFVAYALSQPGTPLMPAWGWAGPTVEGVEAGAWRVARLVMLLGGLAVLLASTERRQLIYGLYVLARPLCWLGFDRRVFAVRLGLVLDYAEAARPGSWRELFETASEDSGQPDRLVLPVQRWQIRDSLVILAALLLLLGVVWA